MSAGSQAKVAEVLDDDGVAQVGERLFLRESQNLPQSHAESPNIRLACEFALDYEENSCLDNVSVCVCLCVCVTYTMSL